LIARVAVLDNHSPPSFTPFYTYPESYALNYIAKMGKWEITPYGKP
tara:strand:- start:490 stop:627 length:138 start_codon:yes stop_codon:yes gene_type:complete